MAFADWLLPLLLLAPDAEHDCPLFGWTELGEGCPERPVAPPPTSPVV